MTGNRSLFGKDKQSIQYCHGDRLNVRSWAEQEEGASTGTSSFTMRKACGIASRIGLQHRLGNLQSVNIIHLSRVAVLGLPPLQTIECSEESESGCCVT